MLSVKKFFLLVTISISTLLAEAPMGPLNPQDINDFLNNMTEADLNKILEELSTKTPEELEELERLGRQILLDSGIDPDTGKPLEQRPAEPAAPAPQKATEPIFTKPVEVKPVVKTHKQEDAQKNLEAIRDNINALRKKAFGNDLIARRLAQWDQTLADLLFYVQVINKKEHTERLTLKEFDELFNTLDHLSKQLKTYQPQILLPEALVNEDDPYSILGVPYSATDQEITKQYKELKSTYDPQHIKKQLKQQSASKKEIDRELRASSLTLSLIQDAYNQLHDPKTRALIDEKRAASVSDQLSPQSHQYLTQTIQAISNAIYQQKLLTEFQEFLKKYEPEQLAHKQALDNAIAQRKKEHEELAKLAPQKSTIQPGSLEKPVARQAATTPQYNYNYPDTGYYPSYGGGYDNYGYPTAQKVAAPQAAEKGGGTVGGKGASAGKKGGIVGGEKPSEEEDKKKKDDDRKKLQEKADEDKRKKDDAKRDEEIKSLKEQLEKKNEPAKTPAEKPGMPKPGEPAVVSANLQENMPDIRYALNALDQELKTAPARAALNKTRSLGGAVPPLTQAELQQLPQQPLELAAQELTAFQTKLVGTPTISAALTKDWSLTSDQYVPMLTRMKKYLDEENAKYDISVAAIQKPTELTKLTSTLERAIDAFNTISFKLTGRSPIAIAPAEDESDEN